MAAFTVFKMQRSVSRLNVVGLVLALIGAVRYTIISQRERKISEKHDAKSPGLAKKAAKPEGRGDGSAAPLLPITVEAPAPAHSSILVNGKRSGKRGGEGRKGGKADVKTAMAKVKAESWRWWSGQSGDPSRRNR